MGNKKEKIGLNKSKNQIPNKSLLSNIQIPKGMTGDYSECQKKVVIARSEAIPPKA